MGLRRKDSSRDDERKVRRAAERSGVWAKERRIDDDIERRIDDDIERRMESA